MSCIFAISQLDDSDFYEFYDSCNFIDLPFLSNSKRYDFPQLNRGLKIGHLNKNGLFDKLDQLTFLIHSINFDILFISETHLNINQDYPGLKIDGYNFIRKDRRRIWGGIGCFFKDSISVNILESPDFRNETESFCLSVKVQYLSPILISCLYRKPDNSKFNEFFEDLNPFLNKLSSYFSTHKEFYLLGDLNIDLLKKWSMGDRVLQIFQPAYK
jgi:exonuclease III